MYVRIYGAWGRWEHEHGYRCSGKCRCGKSQRFLVLQGPNYRSLEVAGWDVGIKSKSSGGAVQTFNHRVVSTAMRIL